ncbi:MAG TPA: hypothetical protein VKS81_03690 [Bacteroidota bacterium]|nr:hypothetical protein [Bacteroidota bacterium]
MNHPSEIELQQFVDAKRHDESMNEHLRTCYACTRKVRVCEKNDRMVALALRVKGPAGIEEKILRRLGISEAPSLAWIVLKNLAPALGLLIVAGSIIAIFYLTGVLQQSELKTPADATSATYAHFAQTVNAGSTSVTRWLHATLPFLFGAKGISITLFFVVFFLILVLLDRYVMMPFARARTQR